MINGVINELDLSDVYIIEHESPRTPPVEMAVYLFMKIINTDKYKTISNIEHTYIQNYE